jgi:hypothetical protein
VSALVLRLLFLAALLAVAVALAMSAFLRRDQD